MRDKERLFNQEQVCGCFLGGAVGDALGYAVEFCSCSEILRRFGQRGITRYVLNREGLAEISDDTQMTLYTATGMLFASTRGHTHGIAGNPEMYIWRHYADWYLSQIGDKTFGVGGSWLALEKRLRVRRAPGNTCMSALEILLKEGEDNRIRNNSKGCGGVMRVAPVAVTNEFPFASEDDIVTLGSKVADITHNHPLGTLPAAAFVMILRRIVTEKCSQNFNCFAELVQRVADSLKNIHIDYDGPTYGETYPEETERFKALLLRTVELCLSPRTDAECIREIGEGWVADEALAIALFCALRHMDSFEDAVIAAVNHDGDSDSTGSICGNIMGLFVGEKGIPDYFLENLELRDIIEEVAQDVYYGCRISEYSNFEDISPDDARLWELKYIDSVRDERDKYLYWY